MNHAAVVPVVLPALAAALMLIDRRLASQRVLAWVSTLLLAGCGAWLVTLASDGWRSVYLLGNWAAPWGIVLVADRLSALMVATTALLALIALGASRGGWDRRGEHFHPLFQIQLMGLNGAFLTGDLFNLFVFFEVLLIASYGLLMHGNGTTRIAAGLRFVTLNLFGSTLFLFAAGLLYGVTGTLNLADIAQRIPSLGGGDATLARIGAWLLLTVFALKAALLPLYLWLPATYAAATPPVAALFAVMTKVGIYGVLRVYTMVFGADAGALANAAFPWIVWVAAAGYVIAMLGAVAGADLRRLAAMLLIGSAAFLLIGIGLATERSIAAAVFYLPTTTLSAAALYLIADVVGRSRGALADRLLAGPAPFRPAALGLLFFGAAIGLAGLPPLGGFIGKAMLLASTLPVAGGGTGAPPGTATAGLWAVVLGGSLLAMIALARAGSVIFWKSAGSAPAADTPAAPTPRTAQGTIAGTASRAVGTDGAADPADVATSLLPSGVAVAAIVAMAVFAAPIQRYAQATAHDLLVPATLVDQVLRTVPRAGPHQPRPESFR